MYHLSLTLETPAENIAHDETLLAQAEAGELPGEVLRLWESPQPVVILGRSSPASEVRADACRDDGVAVWRRASGGAAVVAGPGCLMYAVILDRRTRPELSGIDKAHNFVLRRLIAALGPLALGVACDGTSDLVFVNLDGRPPKKFSGNALRMKREHLLYHGTILYDFPLETMGRWLAQPARQPKYREGRDHSAFLKNFPASRADIEAALVDAWQAHEPLPC
jgi:lipoate-protein ligase A